MESLGKGWKWIISHVSAQFWLFLLKFVMMAAQIRKLPTPASFGTVWPFFTTRGPSKTQNVLLIFHAPTLCFKETVFIFHVSFHKLRKYTDPKHFILEYSKKEKREPCYDFKSKGFLGFVYIKWSHSILGTFPPHYIHIPLLSKVLPFKKTAIIRIMLHLKTGIINDIWHYF